MIIIRIDRMYVNAGTEICWETFGGKSSLLDDVGRNENLHAGIGEWRQ